MTNTDQTILRFVQFIASTLKVSFVDYSMSSNFPLFSPECLLREVNFFDLKRFFLEYYSQCWDKINYLNLSFRSKDVTIRPLKVNA